MSDLIVPPNAVNPVDMANFIVTLNDIKRNVEHIKTTSDATNANVLQIKEFIGYVEHPSEANPGMHEKFKALFDRVYKLEHFRTWSKTIGIALALAAGFVAKEYFEHQKNFSLHKLEHRTEVKKEAKVENKSSSDLANK